MQTRLLDAIHNREQAIAEAAETLRTGGLVAFPTETVYGLGAAGLRPEAVEQIFVAKGRPHSDPLILHVGEPQWIDDLTETIPETARRLTERFWPGPLTLVLPKAVCVPDLVTAEMDSVAVRMPAHPIALDLIRRVGEPLAAPSANRFGHTSPTAAEHVLADLDGRIDAVLDGGPTSVGVESTVLDVRQDPPVILRPGGITREMLEETLGCRVGLRGESPGEGMRSPGLLTRHYSPRAELRLYTGADAVAAIGRDVPLLPDPSRAVILAYAEDMPAYDLPAKVLDLGRRSDLGTVARRLYTALRRADGEHATVIFARTAPPGGLGDAINDRLLRAASGRIRVEGSPVEG